MMNNNLPQGWVHAKISEVSHKGEQRKPEADEDFIYVDIGSIDRILKRIAEPQTLKGSEAPSRARKVINSGNVLVSLTRPNLNAVALVPEKYDRQIASTGFEVIKPIQVDSRYIFALTRSKHFVGAISGATQGALYPAAKSSDVQSYTFPLPPLAEQKIIAQKLDTLLAQVESTKARLERTREILKRFRQSVLAAAVSGKLTEEWRGNSSAEWQSVTLIDALEAKPRNGHSPKGVNYETPYKNLTLSATTKGYFVEEKFKYIELDIEEDSYLWVKNGDILIQRANTHEYVGVSAIYRGLDNVYVYPDLMMKCIPNNKAIGEFLHYCLLSTSVRKYFRDNATGTAGNMPKINQTVVSRAPIQLPSLEEQTEIVRRVEQLFAHADTIEKQTEAALARVNNLTQSILAKAFRGELTAQWRAENPELISGENSAEALLAKIKAERAAQAPRKSTSRKKKATAGT